MRLGDFGLILEGKKKSNLASWRHFFHKNYSVLDQKSYIGHRNFGVNVTKVNFGQSLAPLILCVTGSIFSTDVDFIINFDIV